MIAALKEELSLRKEYLGGEMVRTIYYGGGTPSILAPKEVAALQQHIKEVFRCAPSLEVTLELNPDDATLDKLVALQAAGINRLSIGVQSFHDPLLRKLNRSHKAAEAVASVKIAREAQFCNVSIDLMYGLPQGSTTRWREDLLQAVALTPEHIAAYCLALEPATLFGRWHKQGRLQAVPQEVAAEQFHLMTSILTEAGYVHYETSNFCLPGYYACHNSNYWRKVPYLGVGPGAHSFDGSTRQYNVRNNRQYIDAITTGKIPCRREHLSRREHINEYLMTSLRTMWGCDLAYLEKKHGYRLLEAQAEAVSALQAQGLVILREGYLFLTQRGKPLADGIVTQLWLS